MRRNLWLEPLFWAATIVFAMLTVRTIAEQGDIVATPSQPTMLTTVHVGDTIEAGEVRAAIAIIESRNPFDLEASQLGIEESELLEFRPEIESENTVLQKFQLGGVLSGPPWEALIEGISGSEGGVLVQAGDTAGGYRIESIGWDSVVIEGPDSSWTLTIKQEWE